MGIKSAGQLFSRALIAHGFSVHDYNEYPSLVRGGHNTYQVSFSSQKIFSPHYSVDYFFSLAGGHWQEHLKEFSGDTLVFGDENFNRPPSPAKFISLPIKQIIDSVGNSLVVNTVCLGVIAFLLELDTDIFTDLLSSQYGKLAEVNLNAFHRAYDYAKNNYSPHIRHLSGKKLRSPQILVDGNEAFGWGFLKGGGDFYAAYPMTPATGALHFLAEKQKDHSIIVLHPEDELAVANIGAGAAVAGRRVAVGTSGGGFVLMDETISFCGIAEIGMVYYLVSRPGPATGLPTWTSQGDLLHAVHAGHGEFPKVVLAPGNQEESFAFGQLAINLAVRLQTPVVVVSDKFLAESSASLPNLSRHKTVVNQGKREISPKPGYRRYRLDVPDGISPYTIPGQSDGEFLSNSYEHDEFGFATEDSVVAASMNEKRFKKNATARRLVPQDLLFGPKGASKLIVSWGSPSGPILEMLNRRPLPEYNFLQVRTLWPVSARLPKIIGRYRQIIVVENNQTGQLSALLKSQFSFAPHRQINKFDGRPYYPEELYHLITGQK